jgi:hypothetical protein
VRLDQTLTESLLLEVAWASACSAAMIRTMIIPTGFIEWAVVVALVVIMAFVIEDDRKLFLTAIAEEMQKDRDTPPST